MTLLDRARALASDVNELNARKNMADQVKAVTARREAFGDARALIIVAAGRRAALRRHGVEVSIDTAGIKPLRLGLETWKTQIAANPGEIVAPGSTVQNQLIHPLKTMARRIEESSAAAWSAHVGEHLPRVASDTLTLRERLPGMKRKVDAFRDALARAQELAKAPPTSDAGFAQFQARASACRDAWADLEGEALPDDVRRFLQAAGQPGGASIELLLKGETLEWLRTHGLIDHFRIRGS